MAMQNQAPISKPLDEINTVIIFDFDDTLFPTGKLEQILARTESNKANYSNKYQEKSPESKELESKITRAEEREFEQMSWETCDLLLFYIEQYSKQNICVVTASREGWIKKALSHVYYIGGYSIIYGLLFDDDAISLSQPSNSQYKNMLKKCNDLSKHPCTHWKYQMFQQIVDEKAKISDDLINIFVIIGDSYFEFEAAKKLREYVADIDNVFIHRIKFEHNPTFKTLIKEQNLLNRLGQDRYYQIYSLLKQEGFCLQWSKRLQYKSGEFSYK